MNRFIAAAFAAGLAAIGATASQAMPIAPMAPAGDSMVTRVADGCGRGFYRTPRGFCRPMDGRPVVVRPARPVIVAPPIVVAPRYMEPRPRVVRPLRACPPGFFLSRGGNCRPIR